MKQLNIKTSHKVVKDYYLEMEKLSLFHADDEGSVSSPFANLLNHCAKKMGWRFQAQYPLKVKDTTLRPDGAIFDEYNIRRGLWEAKDTKDNLDTEIKKKFQKGYPSNNIIFQTPEQVVIWQNGIEAFRTDITVSENLVRALKLFFEYKAPEIDDWKEAVEKFKPEIPEIAKGILILIEREREKYNKEFIEAFDSFAQVCRESINPNISIQAIEEMIIQHLLTERIFSNVFNNPDFTRKNVIAREIEKVVDALTSGYLGRRQFLEGLDRFYKALENAAATIKDFSEKQVFLNTVYEKFFQGFSVKVADTHGIVYTPQPVVKFMVKSVEDILQREFGRSLSDKNVHILDPFVGTGNFILHVMREIKKTSLEYKYDNEIHCNEVMLLPYYIASMNIEHEYSEMTGKWKPFKGICLVDTFELAEDKQMSIFTEENTERVQRQKDSPIFVILGNPPYNMGQVNENDNNKNRKYKTIDGQVSETYARDSNATLLNKLADPYVKAIRFASNRITENGEGIVAFITNNSFLDAIAFDGMRKNLGDDFNRIYVLDLKGNIRKDSMRDGIPLGEQHTVFGLSAMVGISISFFVKSKKYEESKVFYSDIDFRATRLEKFALIENARIASNLNWKELKPTKKYLWLTEGMSTEFDEFIPMGTKEAKKEKTDSVEVLFNSFSCGVMTSRDAWAYNFDKKCVEENMERMIETYNNHVFKYQGLDKIPNIDDFVEYDEKKINWSRRLKRNIQRGNRCKFSASNIRTSEYRPFIRKYLYFDKMMNEEVYQLPHIFPTFEVEKENRVICVSGRGSTKPFQTLLANSIVCFDVLNKTQCFPFYTYDEDGTNRKENITDWALMEFRKRYKPSDSDFVGATSLVKGGTPDEVPFNKGDGAQQQGISISEGQRVNSPLADEITEGQRVNSSEGPRINSSEGQEINNEPSDSDFVGATSLVKGGTNWQDDPDLIERAKEHDFLYKGRYLPYDPKLKRYARELRKNMTKAERKLWFDFLKNLPQRFICQHPIDHYIVDFYYPKAKLVIEVDGDTHFTEMGKEYDEERTYILERYGLSTIRYTNNDILDKFVSVCCDIEETLRLEQVRSTKGSKPDEAPINKGDVAKRQGINSSDGQRVKISKWDIFYYVYGILHHPEYRKKFAANLKRELPRIPFAPNFWKFAEAGKQLAELHVNYEEVEEYPLKMIETEGEELDWRVEKMRYNKEKTQIRYNDFLTIAGIPSETHEYHLGNRSALDWIIDQYRVKSDKRSSIVSDPNRKDEPDYIVKLIKKIVSVSLETVKIVKELEKEEIE